MRFFQQLRLFLASAALATSALIAASPSAAQTVNPPIATGTGSAAIAVNPATNKVYVANETSNDLTVIDASTRTTTTVPVGQRPFWVGVNPETNKVYVSNFGTADVSILHGDTDTITTTASTGGSGWITINPFTNKAYVVRYGAGDEFNIIDDETYVNTAAERSYQPIAIAVNPVTNVVYLVNAATGDLVAVDGSVDTFYPTLFCPDGSGGFRPTPGQFDPDPGACVNIPDPPVAVAVNPVTDLIYTLSSTAGEQISVVNGISHSFPSTIVHTIGPTGISGAAKAIAVNPVTNRIYAAFADGIAIVNGADNTYSVIPAGSSGGGPVAVGLNTTTNKIYVPSSDGTLLVIDGDSGTVAATLTIPSGAKAVAVNPVTNRIYVLTDSGVTEIDGAASDTVHSIPVTTTITPLAGDSSPPTGSITLTASSTMTPAALGTVRKVRYQIDGTNGAWSTASGSGPYTASFSGLAAGTHTIYAYATNGLDGPSIMTDLQNNPIVGNVASYTFTVSAASKQNPTVSLASSRNPSTVGDSVTFTANVTGSSGTPSGTVDFLDGTSVISGCSATALASGSATCATSALATGTHSITARYSGDATYNGATSAAIGQVVNPVAATATIALSSSLNPSTDGQSVTFTATASGSSGTATGTMSFLDGGTSIGGCSAVALSGGAAACTTASLSVGSHSITASYSGDSTYGSASSGTLTQTVQPASSGTSANVALASAGAAATASSTYSASFPASAAIDGDRSGAGYGHGGVWLDGTRSAFPDWLQVQLASTQSIDKVIVYSMQDNYSTPVDPSDTLTFTRYGVVAFDVQVWNGAAWVTVGSVTGNNLVKRSVTFSPVSTDRVRVVIDNALAGSSRLAEVEVWTAGGTGGGSTPVDATIGLSSSANPSTEGQGVTFTANVSGSAGTATGTVTFTDGGSAIPGCSGVALSSGAATCATSTLAAGTHPIVASYGGDAHYNAGTSSTLTQTVQASSGGTPVDATIGLSSSANPSTEGDSVTFTASVSGSAGEATGTVSFTDGGAAIPGCSNLALSSGAATCATSTLAAGTHAIVASYGGDAHYNAGTSSTLTQTVQAGSGGSTPPVNVALASAGGVVTASSTYSASFPTSAVNDGDRSGAGYGHGGIWLDGTRAVFPDWVQIQFAGAQTLASVIVYSMQDNYSTPVDPSDTMTFNNYGVTDFDVQVWNGSDWVTVGSVTGNNLVKRTVTFSPTTTDRIRVVIHNAKAGSSRLAEVEAWTAGSGGTSSGPVDATISVASSANPSTEGQSLTFTTNVSGSNGQATGSVDFIDGGAAIAGCTGVALSAGDASCTTSALSAGTHSITVHYSGDGSYTAGTSAVYAQTVQPASSGSSDVNVGLASGGAVATASSTYSASFPVSAILDGDRTGAGYGQGGIWVDGTRSAFPDWVQVQLPATKTVDRVIVYSMQDNYSTPVDPSDTMTFNNYGITDFTVQVWDGSTWVAVASVAGNNLVKRAVTFAPTATQSVRVVITNAKAGNSRLAEVEVWGQ